jgi:hypothetical protein
MLNFKATAAFALMASVTVIASAAQAQESVFAAGTNENLTWNAIGSNGLLNFAGGTEHLDLGDYLGSGLGSYNVVETFNNGAGIATSGLVNEGGGNYYFDTTQAFTISYALATPTNIDGNYVTNLLTVSVGAGTEFDFSAKTTAGRQHVTGSWTFDSADISVVYSSDLLKFLNVVDEGGSFSFSSGSFAPATGSITSLGFSGNSNYSSDPLPQVPEPLSAALLVVGMTAVGVASRRRRAN